MLNLYFEIAFEKALDGTSDGVRIDGVNISSIKYSDGGIKIF